MKKTIHIIRHGQTEFNKLRIIQGSGVDSDLNDRGREQGQLFFEKYKEHPFEVVLTSTLKRTHQTVERFIESGLPWEQFPEIVEMNWGVHEGKSGNEDMKKDYDRVVLSGNFDERIEGGESINEMAERLQQFIDHLPTRAEKNILVCIHGRAMRCLICLLEQKDLKEMENYPHSNTGLYLVEHDSNGFIVLEKNNTEHLKKEV
ncbi:MAG: histidine phosphatase family protein [Saprospiraceae bacterium]